MTQAPAPERVGLATTRILLALVAEHEHSGRATVKTVALRVARSVATTHYHLAILRQEGLVTWEPGSQGTLRPMVHPQTLNPTSRPR